MHTLLSSVGPWAGPLTDSSNLSPTSRAASGVPLPDVMPVPAIAGPVYAARKASNQQACRAGPVTGWTGAEQAVHNACIPLDVRIKAAAAAKAILAVLRMGDTYKQNRGGVHKGRRLEQQQTLRQRKRTSPAVLATCRA